MRETRKRWAIAIPITHHSRYARLFRVCTREPLPSLYIGITNDLLRRVAEHREGMDTFTSKYRITRLVYFETTSNVMSAIEREKQLKGWVRKKKIAFIETENTLWQDLAAGWFEETTCHPEKRSEPPCYPEERSELPCHPEERSDEGSTLSFPKPATKNGR